MAAAPLPTRDGVGPSRVALPTGPWPTIAEFLVAALHGHPACHLGSAHPGGRSGGPARHPRHADTTLPGAAARLLLPLARQRAARALRGMGAVPRRAPAGGRQAAFPDRGARRQVRAADASAPAAKAGPGPARAPAPHRPRDRRRRCCSLCSRPRARPTSALFAERAVVKHYEAIVPWGGTPALPAVRRSRLVDDTHFMRMREVEGEPKAETRFELLEARDGWARLRLSPVTGRRHQLRVHCAALGLRSATTPSTPRCCLRAPMTSTGRCSCWPSRWLFAIRSTGGRAPSKAPARWPCERVLVAPTNQLRPKS